MSTESTPRTAKKKPISLAFGDCAGADPFPSVGSPSLTSFGGSLVKTPSMLPPAELEASTAAQDGLSKSSGKGLRPQLTIEVDDEVAGADPMPSLDAKRVEGGSEPLPWEDSDFDPTLPETDFTSFDDEDASGSA